MRKKRLYYIIGLSYFPIITTILATDFRLPFAYNEVIFWFVGVIFPVIIFVCSLALMISELKKDILIGTISIFLILAWVGYFYYRVLQNI